MNPPSKPTESSADPDPNEGITLLEEIYLIFISDARKNVHLDERAKH